VGRAGRGTKKAGNTLYAIILISIESMNTSIDKRIADSGTLFRKAYRVFFADKMTTRRCKPLDKKW